MKRDRVVCMCVCVFWGRERGRERVIEITFWGRLMQTKVLVQYFVKINENKYRQENQQNVAMKTFNFRPAVVAKRPKALTIFYKGKDQIA